MKKLLFLSLTICGLFLLAQNGYSQKIVKVEIVQPQSEFDFKLATDMLNTGSATIKGKILFETKTGFFTKDKTWGKTGNKVSLYPITPYFNEFLELRKKDKKDKRMAAISREANSFRIETKVYSIEGDFMFTGLKPGKYFIEGFVYFLGGIGGYQVDGIVQINTEGETVEAKIKSKYETKNPYLSL
jgi:hypothetical protein